MSGIRLLMTFCVATGVILGAPVWAASPRSKGVFLRVDPESTLAGLPVAMLVTLPIDPGEIEEYEIKTFPVVLLITPEDTGETVDATWEGAPNTVGLMPVSVRTHLPNRTVEVQIPMDPPGGQGWFADAHFQRPGKYRLQLRILASQEGLPEDYLSSQATLEVRQPTGIDAEAWAWLRAQPHHRARWPDWYDSPDILVNGVIDKFPRSEYARYAVNMFIHDPPSSDVWLKKAIMLSKGTWLEDFYRLHQLTASAASLSPSCSGTPVQMRSCMAAIVVEVRKELLEIAKRTESESVRHLAASEHRRLKGHFGSAD